MINTEYLAITAIFGAGLYVGFKIKEGIYSMRNYLKRKNNRKENLF